MRGLESSSLEWLQGLETEVQLLLKHVNALSDEMRQVSDGIPEIAERLTARLIDLENQVHAQHFLLHESLQDNPKHSYESASASANNGDQSGLVDSTDIGNFPWQGLKSG
jgi:hypothetical protein